MEYKIIISGGISGNRQLVNHCGVTDRLENRPFHGYALYYSSKKEATKALSEAYQELKNDTMCSYSRGNFFRYDASVAEIMKV